MHTCIFSCLCFRDVGSDIATKVILDSKGLWGSIIGSKPMNKILLEPP